MTSSRESSAPDDVLAFAQKRGATTTLDQVITGGAVRRRGRLGAYRRLAYGPGERRRVRAVAAAPSALGRGATSLARLVHFTDFQLADVQSPGRFEFFQELAGRPGASAFVPAQRPQEALAVHSCDVMARTVRGLGASPETGAPLGLALCTGDNIDNAQANELAMFIGLLSGGEVAPSSGGPTFQGVQARAWHNPLFWHPDQGTDQFKSEWGFPEHPGLLDEAMAPFQASGVGVPWLSCFGNHDGLVLGTALPTPAYREAVVGRQKAVGLPPGPDLLERAAEFLSDPDRFLAGPSQLVDPDPDRHIVGRTEFVAAHLGAPGLPRGHGYREANLRDGTAYAAYDDIDHIRMLLLDTANLDGYHHGSIGRRQMHWLEERLIEVHSTYRSADGEVVTTTNADRVVVLASHHGLATLTNARQDPGGFEQDHPRATTEEARALLHRFGNVVLWLNGHRHLNEVVHWPSPYDPTTGIWEVSTASMADWPCQARAVELVAGSNGSLSILLTMLDHGAAPEPENEDGRTRLAALHRELAANIPGAGLEAGWAGGPGDRNVELVMPMPFPL